jgi:hypothetical protein
MSISVMPDLIRHPEGLKTLDSGFRRNDGSHPMLFSSYGLISGNIFLSRSFNSFGKPMGL